MSNPLLLSPLPITLTNLVIISFKHPFRLH
jgi:hypothetical protein